MQCTQKCANTLRFHVKPALDEFSCCGKVTIDALNRWLLEDLRRGKPAENGGTSTVTRFSAYTYVRKFAWSCGARKADGRQVQVSGRSGATTTDGNTMNVIAREAVRQQKETFEQLKRQDRQWFMLRLTMGYAAVILLLAVLAACGAILFGNRPYPAFVLKAASATLFADVAGLLVAVWKFALSPNFHNRLNPITSTPDIARAAERPDA